MLRRAGALVVTVLALTACGDEAAPETWRLVTFEVGGELRPIDEPLFLEVDGERFTADTPCNTVGGEFGGQLESTAMGCDQARHDAEALMTQAFADDPVEIDGRLVFVAGDVRLIYEQFTDPATLDLIAVLGDERRSVDPSVALPPESATGTVPPEYDALIPVASPAPNIDLFLGSLDGRPCVVYGTETSVGSACTGPRELSFRTRTANVPDGDPSYLRVAIIPDDFAAVAERSGLGTYDTNLLIVADAVPAGTQVLTNSAEHTLAVVIGEPSAEPPTSSVPTTEP